MVPEGEERKDLRNIWRDNSWKIPNMGKEIIKQVQEIQSLMQDQPKEEYTETQ